MYIINEATNEEKISLIVDILDLGTLSDAQRDKYILKLKNEYGYIYVQPNDDEKIKEASLQNILSIDSFTTFNKYQEYAMKILKLRNYKMSMTMKIWEPITIQQVSELCKHYSIAVKLNKSTTILAYSRTNDIIMPEYVDKSTVIHELGHVVQFIQKYQEGRLIDIVNSPSKYGTTNGGECFAEGFLHFTCDKNYKKEFYHLTTEWNRVAKKYLTLVNEILEAPNIAIKR